MAIDPKVRPISMAKVNLTDEEINAVIRVLKSGHLCQGEKVAEFEACFAKKVGSQYAVAVASGTAALHMAYLVLLEPGSEILVPTYSHISTASMAFFANCKPVLCDLMKDSFLLDLESAKHQLTEKTRAIAPVHLFGNVCDIESISAFAKDNNLRIIWDAAQAHGAEYNGEPIGKFADVVTYSFYATKNITTGEGGMITTNDIAVRDKLRLLRSHGQTEKYFHPSLGLHYRMTEFNAAIGVEQVKKLEAINDARRKNAAFFNQQFSSLSGVKPQAVEKNVKHVYHQYTLSLDLDKITCSRDEFVAQLNNLGITTAIHYPLALHQQPALVEKNGLVSLPISEALCKRVFSLPVHPLLSEEDLHRIAQGVIDVYAKNS